MDFDPLKPPTQKNYLEWRKAQAERTQKVILNQKAISGAQIRDQLLSMDLITKSGFDRNPANGFMERK